MRALDRRRLIGWALAMPLVAGLTVFAVYPLVYLIFLSFSESSLGTLFRGWVGVENYSDAMGQAKFTASLLRSVVFALMTTLASLALGVGIALLIDRAAKGRQVLCTLILLPLMTPPITVAVMWQLLLMPSGGWLNSFLTDMALVSRPVSFLGSPAMAFPFLCLADVWQWSPFVALTAYAALRTLPDDIYEAARLDGASGFAMFRSITLPLLAPALLAIAVLKLVIAFKVFDLVFVLTGGGPGQATTVASFYIYRVAIQQFDMGAAAAQTLMFAGVVGLVTVPFVAAHGLAERRLS